MTVPSPLQQPAKKHLLGFTPEARAEALVVPERSRRADQKNVTLSQQACQPCTSRRRYSRRLLCKRMV